MPAAGETIPKDRDWNTPCGDRGVGSLGAPASEPLRFTNDERNESVGGVDDMMLIDVIRV
jgi:hypothetical protein